MAIHWRRSTGRLNQKADSSTTSEGDRKRMSRSRLAVT